MRIIVSQNVQHYMRLRFSKEATDSARMAKLAEKAETSPETIRRIITRAVGPSIDTIEDIAKILRVPAPKLFVASPELRDAVSVDVAEETAGPLQRNGG